MVEDDENTTVNGVSVPPIKDYDIVPTIWNTPANATVGELLANSHYRNELLTAIHTMENRESSGQNINQVHTRTTALYMTVRINEKRVQVIPDSGAAVSIVSDTTAENLGLKVFPVQKCNLSAFGNPLEVLGKTEAILKIENVEMLVSLLVVDSTQKNILLGMDWFDMYDVALDIPIREIMFVIGRQRIKTYVHFEKGELINCVI
jgi:predicted aspartyl protease